MVYKLKHIGSGIAGRPKGTENLVTTICWENFCCDLRSMKEFEVPIDNHIIYYIINKNERIGITKVGETTYEVSYINDSCGLTINCQKLTNDTKLDKFVNRLLMDNWDWTIEGKIKQFCIGNETDEDLED